MVHNASDHCLICRAVYLKCIFEKQSVTDLKVEILFKRAISGCYISRMKHEDHPLFMDIFKYRRDL